MKRFRRVRTYSERDEREAAGFWKAIGLVREIAESNEKITLKTILRIHQVFFQDVMPEAAGRFRRNGQDVKKLKCTEPPPGRLVTERMYVFWREFDTRISTTPSRARVPTSEESRRKWFKKVLELAVWTQHQIAAIHPFVEGNGRMARLLTNLVLERFGIKPSTVKYEGEMREEYLKALCQADRYGDYEPLKKLISQGIKEEYEKEKKLRERIRYEKKR